MIDTKPLDRKLEIQKIWDKITVCKKQIFELTSMGKGRSVARTAGSLLKGERKQLNQLKVKLILLGTNYEEQKSKYNMYVRTGDFYQIKGTTSGRFTGKTNCQSSILPDAYTKHSKEIRAILQKQIQIE